MSAHLGWIDASAGASGDMLLGALVGAGVPLGVLSDAVAKVAGEEVSLEVEQTRRNGIAATRVVVGTAQTDRQRTWRDIERLLAGAGLHEDVRATAHDTFARLAEAEAVVHGTTAAEVHFHEVGALDAIADIVGAAAGFVHLGLREVHVSSIGVGAGSVRAAHGTIPVPVPAVVELLRGVPSQAGPAQTESCTPTGAALLTTLADSWGAQPAMAVAEVGIGAGGRDPDTHANVLRLLIGEPSAAAGAVAGTDAVLLECNVDDFDPRLWPGVIDALLAVGASDAWLTPILMKKGRPAHTLSALVGARDAAAVRRVIFEHTTTIGLREVALDAKHALRRELVQVQVDGRSIAVKLARDEAGSILNAQPEFEDVAAAARELGRPVKEVLAEAVSAIRDRLPRLR